jgi:D-arginine dehydrogenase
LAIERVNEATTLALRSVVSAWAGLRTFAPDRVPVVGEDPLLPGVWWLAGQGGYGIQTAPAMARCLADLMTGRGLPADVVGRGVPAADLSPARLRSYHRSVRATAPRTDAEHGR